MYTNTTLKACVSSPGQFMMKLKSLPEKTQKHRNPTFNNDVNNRNTGKNQYDIIVSVGWTQNEVFTKKEKRAIIQQTELQTRISQ